MNEKNEKEKEKKNKKKNGAPLGHYASPEEVLELRRLIDDLKLSFQESKKGVAPEGQYASPEEVLELRRTIDELKASLQESKKDLVPEGLYAIPGEVLELRRTIDDLKVTVGELREDLEAQGKLVKASQTVVYGRIGLPSETTAMVEGMISNALTAANSVMIENFMFSKETMRFAYGLRKNMGFIFIESMGILTKAMFIGASFAAQQAMCFSGKNLQSSQRS